MPIVGAHWINPATGLQGPGVPLPAPSPPASGIHAGASAGVSGGAHGARDEFKHAAMGTGLRALIIPALELADMAIALTIQTQPISPADATAAYMAGLLSDKDWECIVAMHGGDIPLHRIARDSLRRKPETVESAILRNRQVVNDDGHAKLLRQLGFTDPNERVAVQSLRFDVPGPSDLVRFAVRHAFEPEILSALGYNSEYRPALDFYHQTAGLNYPIFTGPLKGTIIATCKEFPEIFQAVVAYARESQVAPPGSPEQVPDWFAGRYKSLNLPEPTWAVMYWWSHWILPSPGQGYQMLQRLRGDPDRPATWRVPGVKPFTSGDLNLLLRANDYPPFWRYRLEAISYRVPGIRQLRVQIQQGTITDEEVVEILQDNGYKRRDAESYALALTDDVREKSREKKFRAIRAELNAGWELGIMSDESFRAAYDDAGFPADQVDAEFQAAVAGRNVRIGKSLLGMVHKAYLRGTFNSVQADQFMVQIGIVDRRRAEYLRVWSGERQAGRKEATAGQLRKAVIDGNLAMADYAARLRNLDYTDDAIVVMLSDVRHVLATQQQHVLQGIARDQEKTAKDRLAALRAAEQQLKQLRADLALSATPSRLKIWWCNGDIELADVEHRLGALGVSKTDIPHWLRECDAKRQKAGLPTYDEAKAGSQGTH